MYNSIIRLSKKLFYEFNLEKNKKNLKNTWNLLNELMNRKTSTNQITEIRSGAESITDSKNIAETFNEFFTSIGPKISNSVPSVNKDPLSYITPHNETEFDIGNFNPSHIIDLLKVMPSKPSNDVFGTRSNFRNLVCACFSVH